MAADIAHGGRTGMSSGSAHGTADATRSLRRVAESVLDYILRLSEAVVLELDQRLTITACNEGFRRLLGTGDDPVGTSLSAFLAVPDAGRLAQLFAPKEGAGPAAQGSQDSGHELLLHFVGAGDVACTLACRARRAGDRLLLFGEVSPRTHSQVIARMSQLNGELVDLNRDMNKASAEAQRALAEFAALFDSLMDPVVMYDTDGRPVRANGAAVSIFGFDPAGVDRAELFQRLDVQRSTDGPGGDDARPSARALRGEQVSGEQWSFIGFDGGRRVCEVSASPLIVGGRMAGAVATWHDVTEREHAESERRRVEQELERANREVSAIVQVIELPVGSLPLDELLIALLQRVVTVLRADTATILLTDGKQFCVQAGGGESGEISQGPGIKPGEGFIGAVAASRRPLAVADAQTDPLTEGSAVRPRGIRAMFGVPLMYREQLVGVLHVDWIEPHEPSERERRVLNVVAVRVSLNLVNARLFDVQRRVAQIVQESFRRPLPRIPGVEIAVDYRFASEAERVGGDFYDVFPAGGGWFAVVVGDVSGKGVEAAGLTETVRSTLRALAAVDPSPGFVMSRAGRALATQIEGDEFVTLLYLLVRPADRSLWVAAAGHPLPVVCSGGACHRLAGRVGLPLGTFESEYLETRDQLLPGDTVVAFTDGLLEARRGDEQFGDLGLERALQANCGRGPAALAAAVRDAVDAFAGGRLDDDMAIVAFRFATDV